MKLRLPARFIRPVAATGMLAVLAALGTTLATTSPEAVVSRSFADALEAPATENPTEPAAPLVAGTEDFWLSRTPREGVEPAHVEPVAWPGPSPLVSLSAGDKITLGSGKSARTLEVVSVSEATETKTGTTARRLEIKARDTSEPTGALVTFTTTVEPASIKGPRTL